MSNFEMRWVKRPEGVKIVETNGNSIVHFTTVLQYRVDGGEWVDVPTVMEESNG